MTSQTSRTARIESLLTAAFAPIRLAVEDDSARHAGHAGTRGLAGGETHFNVSMISAAFTGQTRVQRSRAVHQVLADEIATGLHALSLSLTTPSETKF